MTLPAPHRRAAELEAALGDPRAAESVMSFAAAVEHDEHERFPQAECDALDRWGMAQHYVPEALGGRLRSIEELLTLVRTMARRDLTVAIGHGKTYLGAVGVWVAGSPEQQRTLARRIIAGDRVCLGLTEREHGSDLVATGMRAVLGPSGYVVNGGKWLINNGTRARHALLLVRTEPEAGPRACSLLLVDKQALAPGSLHAVPKIPTHGVRGLDISGLTLEGAVVPPGARIGSAGTGLEVALRMLQLTRVLCSGCSLGAGDTALRCAADFARERRLYGQPVSSIPHARHVLAGGMCELLLADAAAIMAARVAQVCPEQLSVASAVVKAFVPARVEAVLRGASVVLGARHYLRQGHWDGIFQKILRDAPLVGLFDGSTVVNLNGLALQLPALLGGRPEDAASEERWSTLCDLEAPLPALDPRRLTMSARGRDDVVRWLRASGPSAIAAADAGTPEVRAAIGRHVEHLRGELAGMPARLAHAKQRHGLGYARSAEAFAEAQRYGEIWSAAAAIGLWRRRAAVEADTFTARGDWLCVALDRLSPGVAPASSEQWERCTQQLHERLEDPRSLSFIPVPLAS